MKKIKLFLALLLLFNCAKKEKQINKIVNNDSINRFEIPKFDFHDKELQTNLNKAILNGDTLGYIRSYKTYTINGRDKEFLYYAIIMAEKHNYRRAYYDISRILSLRPTDSIYKKNNYSSKFGDYSLLKSYELGDDFAKDDVKDFYINEHKPIPKSSSIYCKE
ncbi:hypothetical protein [Chryseobacterium gossypii]|uniref:hypothetical protein n=1 Tax=Chryseobacterium gossypii TaxID=3231602 RepID=UPI0035240E21